ncbi:hypothetical protein D3C87_1759610 [compost metagenome]
MTQRRTGLSSRRQGGGNTRQDFQIDVVPLDVGGLVQRLEHSRGHGENPGIA